MTVWDEGTWEHLENGRAADWHARGHLDLRLRGLKLRGAFALFRPPGGVRGSWLLVKLNDEEADAEADLLALRPESVRKVSRRRR
jgi:hypothetical protein